MLFVATLLVFTTSATSPDTAAWKTLAPGMEIRLLDAKSPSPVGDSKIFLARINPAAWQLELISRKDAGGATGQTAREWAKAYNFVIAFNAGMYGSDYLTHVGYMESRGQVNSSKVNDYQSVAAFDPRNPKIRSPFRIFDLDEPGVALQTIRKDYTSLVQNLRLIKKPGKNCWNKQDKKWSELALGEDKDGKLILVFSRSPFTMYDLNCELILADIGLAALQHLEGGPPAQLYLKVNDFEIEFFGSSETSIRQDSGNATAWPIPNVLGIRQKSPIE